MLVTAMMLQPPRNKTHGIFMPWLCLSEIPSNCKEPASKEALHMDSSPP